MTYRKLPLTPIENTQIGLMDRLIEHILTIIRFVDKFPLENLFKDTRSVMQKSMDTKKKTALEISVKLGHELNEFRDFAFFQGKSRACCKTCGRYAGIDVSPPSQGGFNMYGPALNEKCRKEA